MVNAALREELLHLDAESRAALARELIASLDDLSEAEIEGLWLGEARRRDREIDRREAGTEPADDGVAHEPLAAMCGAES